MLKSEKNRNAEKNATTSKFGKFYTPTAETVRLSQSRDITVHHVISRDLT